MIVTKTHLEGCFVVTPAVFADERGYFFESFNAQLFQEKTGVTPHFVQDNQSYSTYGVIRGLHTQINDFAQAKLVRVVSGSVWDVAVDVRPHSATFGQHFGVLLSAENQKQLYIPKGFLHGFAVVSQEAIFAYKCDAYYDKASESGIIYNDATLNIDWQIPVSDHIISEKDRQLPTFLATYEAL